MNYEIFVMKIQGGNGGGKDEDVFRGESSATREVFNGIRKEKRRNFEMF